MRGRSLGLLLGQTWQHWHDVQLRYEIRSSSMPKHYTLVYNTPEAREVSHFSFCHDNCKVNSRITVFKLQSNLPGICLLMHLIGHRSACQIMSHGVGAATQRLNDPIQMNWGISQQITAAHSQISCVVEMLRAGDTRLVTFPADNLLQLGVHTSTKARQPSYLYKP